MERGMQMQPGLQLAMEVLLQLITPGPAILPTLDPEIPLSANAAYASLTIDLGGVLNPSGRYTVSATTGITINGTYTNQSTGSITTPSWTCNGTYNHATTSQTLPKGTTTSVWASNLNITGAYTSATVFANFIGQTFGNFTFNPSSMTNTVCL
jgi:hypothetical protein